MMVGPLCMATFPYYPLGHLFLQDYDQRVSHAWHHDHHARATWPPLLATGPLCVVVCPPCVIVRPAETYVRPVVPSLLAGLSRLPRGRGVVVDTPLVHEVDETVLQVEMVLLDVHMFLQDALSHMVGTLPHMGSCCQERGPIAKRGGHDAKRGRHAGRSLVEKDDLMDNTDRVAMHRGPTTMRGRHYRFSIASMEGILHHEKLHQILYDDDEDYDHDDDIRLDQRESSFAEARPDTSRKPQITRVGANLVDAIDLIINGVQNLVIPIKNTSKRKQLWQLLSIPPATYAGGREFCWLTQEDVMRFILSSIGLFSPTTAYSIE
ncbi:hypothetical protein E3N88_34729 [Mikania micrantha]|uniref:Uncharacterized protein n=1 Tax=Mikania micrantha TaxID=192012 RepID=A0A5N6LYY8_9ASTR|nr:hypothetical protein E3N88_34729 [Mikania micrantha]